MPGLFTSEGVGGGEAFEPPQLRREIAVSGERSGGLAPDDESSLAGASAEPAACLFALSPPVGDAPPLVPADATPAASAAVDLAMAERWVRRLAWGTDGRRSTARLELGAGALEGAELVVTTEAGQVTVELQLPATADQVLSARLRDRLEARGYLATITSR